MLNIDKNNALTTRVILFGMTLFLAACESGGTRDTVIAPGDINNPRVKVCSDPAQPTSLPDNIQASSMREGSDLLGRPVPMTTFGLTVADFNGDHRDDVLLGSHSFRPKVLIARDATFYDASDALIRHRKRSMDTHAHTFADIDNDGDLDLVMTGGGAQGVGEGSPNLFFRNDSRDGELVLTPLDPGSHVALPKSRSRVFIPHASADGTQVDLYLTARLREGYPNRLMINTGKLGVSRWREAEDSSLPGAINDSGRGAIADFDGDGKNDYLVVEKAALKIFWHPDSRRDVTTLTNSVVSVAAADFNNDQRLDLYAGRFNQQGKSDRISSTRDKLIYALHNTGNGGDKEISFRTQSPDVYFDLRQHVRLAENQFMRRGKDVYLGSTMRQPPLWRFKAEEIRDAGAPDSFDNPGVYIWYSRETKHWHIRWRFYPGLKNLKGQIVSKGISDIRRININESVAKSVSDIVFFNDGMGMFTPLCSTSMDHQSVTSGITVADFNNDGWTDVAGVRHAEPGAQNIQPFLLTNISGRGFALKNVAPREEDKLARSDLIAHGFFDGDDKPDLVLTNGYGQPPSNKGLARLLLNDTETEHRAVLIRLQGVNANRFGIGAKLTLYDDTGTVLGHRVQGLNTNISQATHWLHFGLGDTNPPYRLSVAWPDGMHSEHRIANPGSTVITQPGVKRINLQ